MQLPGVKEPKRAKDLIKETALLEFKMLDEDNQMKMDFPARVPKEKEAEVLAQFQADTNNFAPRAGFSYSIGNSRPVVVVDVGGRRAALVVDVLLGQQDVVVRRLMAPNGLPPWVGGATILPDGAPALIIDPAALF